MLRLICAPGFRQAGAIVERSMTSVRPYVSAVANAPITWDDGSLGCPKPGMYTRALVDGFRAVLRAAGGELAYHGNTGRPPYRREHFDPHGATGTPSRPGGATASLPPP
jgi:hypothetical protein